MRRHFQLCVCVCVCAVSLLTLGNLSGQRGGDGDEVQVFAAVMDGHLPALAEVVGVGVALSHEQIQRKTPVHQHSCQATEELLQHYSQDKNIWGSTELFNRKRLK